MTVLVIAALVWLVLHIGVSGTRLRDGLVRRLGESGFRGGFSLLSLICFGFLIWGYRTAPDYLLWLAPAGLGWLLVLLMLPAFFLFCAALLIRSPTAVGGRAGAPVTGILRVTRHPMLWSFALWALIHCIGRGSFDGLIFFGTFLLTALWGMPSIDAKLARRDPVAWQALGRETSIVPFAAIAEHRNRLVIAELGWLAPSLGLLVWMVILLGHPWLFGVSPLPH